MKDLVNQRRPLDLMVGKTGNIIYDDLANSPSIESKIIKIEDFLNSYYETAKSRLSIIDEAIDFINDRRGVVTIQEIVTKYKFSSRYLEKKFLEKVGVTPKLYSRIKRFSTVTDRVSRMQKVDWQEIVLENGFHDQSHFVKDFKKFNFIKPSQYHHQQQDQTWFFE
ncbi:AraC family transcriptional regulator [Litoribacter alkaliphilus]|uniref:AraC family transcriptional regulator n=2 Tax=Litoribacter ruber TaxID=702568 RepID=A0AAP2CI35_9BACT|nr:helix-turn-helix domain-containing protein [Litoribacter alkaliphilus]MBS9525118.1 AraC family transcriptional regulator [Litoribacter alkaliphilus]